MRSDTRKFSARRTEIQVNQDDNKQPQIIATATDPCGSVCSGLHGVALLITLSEDRGRAGDAKGPGVNQPGVRERGRGARRERCTKGSLEAIVLRDTKRNVSTQPDLDDADVQYVSVLVIQAVAGENISVPASSLFDPVGFTQPKIKTPRVPLYLAARPTSPIGTSRSLSVGYMPANDYIKSQQRQDNEIGSLGELEPIPADIRHVGERQGT
ncbi:unnamed protein product [Pleuronectes platessa]|uniref:Uncharacterized protein n=1 Tax=Pleuronectes platessa TaxID=8262 RepID=A0A9N7YHX2_PLEPL|nr:unnamed protein product [Pleuronectes platessa]